MVECLWLCGQLLEDGGLLGQQRRQRRVSAPGCRPDSTPIEVKSLLWAQEALLRKLFSLRAVPSQDNTTDFGTKAFRSLAVGIMRKSRRRQRFKRRRTTRAWQL